MTNLTTHLQCPESTAYLYSTWWAEASTRRLEHTAHNNTGMLQLTLPKKPISRGFTTHLQEGASPLEC